MRFLLFFWCFTGDCGAGCLFNVEDDPSESIDRSHDPAQKETCPRVKRCQESEYV